MPAGLRDLLVFLLRGAAAAASWRAKMLSCLGEDLKPTLSRMKPPCLQVKKTPKQCCTPGILEQALLAYTLCLHLQLTSAVACVLTESSAT